MRQTRGFTFIEILVVMVMIAILSTVGMMSYFGYLRSGRDTRRRADIESIRSALELYKSEDANASYPTTLTELDGSTGGSKYITLPDDPKRSEGYAYIYLPLDAAGVSCAAVPGTCTDYTIAAHLENTPSQLCTATVTGCRPGHTPDCSVCYGPYGTK